MGSKRIVLTSSYMPSNRLSLRKGLNVSSRLSSGGCPNAPAPCLSFDSRCSQFILQQDAPSAKQRCFVYHDTWNEAFLYVIPIHFLHPMQCQFLLPAASIRLSSPETHKNPQNPENSQTGRDDANRWQTDHQPLILRLMLSELSSNKSSQLGLITWVFVNWAQTKAHNLGLTTWDDDRVCHTHRI